MRFKRIVFFVIVSFIQLSVLAQDSLVLVTAKRGDGIFSLLRKQGLNPYESYVSFVKLNLSNLRDSVHLYAGRTYRIPIVKKDTILTIDSLQQITSKVEKLARKKVPILGEKYASVAVKSEKLKGAVYYLVSGHGGPDPGAMAHYAKTSIAEDEYAYDITLRLARELISHSATVYIIIRDANDGIRDDRILKIDHDEVAYKNKRIPLNHLARLRQRVAIVNGLHQINRGKFQRLIVTHVDSRSKGQNIDVFFYHHKKSKNGKKLAESIHKMFQKKYKRYQPNRKYTGTFSDRTELYLVRKTYPAMAYIEIGNIRNKKDQIRILEPDNRQALAKWISEGIISDFQSGEIGRIR